MNRKYESRLEKKLENQTKKYFLYTFLGVTALILIVAKFGIPIILGTSTIFSKDNANQQGNSTQDNEISYINAPSLNSLQKATKDDHVIISGDSNKIYDSIKVYDNNELVDKIAINSDGKFSHPETLKEGKNNFTTKALKGGKESDFSNTVSIVSYPSAPDLSIDSPSDNSTLSKTQNPVIISGHTDPNAKVTVNDHQAVMDENGKYSYLLSIQNGGGLDIKVEVVDLAGNKTDKQIHITYNP